MSEPPQATSPGPYAGSPGTPMQAYTVDSGAAPRDHQGALIAFILGIFSVVGFAVVGPVAWIMASKALTEMDRPNAPVYTNRGLAVAAKVLGIIGTIFLALSMVAIVGVAAFAVVAARNGRT